MVWHEEGNVVPGSKGKGFWECIKRGGFTMGKWGEGAIISLISIGCGCWVLYWRGGALGIGINGADGLLKKKQTRTVSI